MLVIALLRVSIVRQFSSFSFLSQRSSNHPRHKKKYSLCYPIERTRLTNSACCDCNNSGTGGGRGGMASNFLFAGGGWESKTHFGWTNGARLFFLYISRSKLVTGFPCFIDRRLAHSAVLVSSLVVSGMLSSGCQKEIGRSHAAVKLGGRKQRQ